MTTLFTSTTNRRFIFGLLGILCFGQSCFAATQGSWGPTSTATAKITLVIHPHNGSATTTNTGVAPPNAVSLAKLCDARYYSDAQQWWTGQYELQLLDGDQQHSLEQVLAAFCKTQHARNSATSPSNSPIAASLQPTTLLIAPL